MSVTVSYLHPGHVDAHFHLCLLRMLHRDWCRPDGQLINGHLPVEANSAGITDSRNVAVSEYLSRYEDEWLFIVDSDMGFAADTVERLLESADPVERPIMGGLCFGQFVVSHGMDELGTPQDGYGYAPTLYAIVDQKPVATPNYPKDTIVETAATGAACLLVHRSVFEKMAQDFAGPHHWFARPIIDGREFGEDITFCLRARASGFPIYVDTSVKTSHKKYQYLTEDSVGHLTRDHAVKARPVPMRPSRSERRRQARSA